MTFLTAHTGHTCLKLRAQLMHHCHQSINVIKFTIELIYRNNKNEKKVSDMVNMVNIVIHDLK